MDPTTIITPIRAQYPAPIAIGHSSDLPAADEYCIGTAVCRYYGYDVEPFVGEHELASILAELNPALDNPPEQDNEEEVPDRAWQYATAITTHNDERDFEAAWRLAGEALTAETEAAD